MSSFSWCLQPMQVGRASACMVPHPSSKWSSPIATDHVWRRRECQTGWDYQHKQDVELYDYCVSVKMLFDNSMNALINHGTFFNLKYEWSYWTHVSKTLYMIGYCLTFFQMLSDLYMSHTSNLEAADEEKKRAPSFEQAAFRASELLI